MKHINKAPLIVTGNGTTHVNTAYPKEFDKPGLEVYNSSATVLLFVKSGTASTVADATCQFVPPGQTKTFIRNKDDTHLDIVFEAASTAKVYASPVDPNGVAS